MALLDIGNAWQADDGSDTFKKFIGACLVAATAIKNESAGTGNHTHRLIWANAVLSGDDATVRTRARQIIRWAASTNATFQGNPTGMTDNDVQFIVNSAIDTFATGS